MAATTSSCSQTIGMVGDEEMGLVCRICQEAINRAKDIFAEQEPGKLIYEIIDDICRLGIFPGDGLSRHICTSCYQSTLQFYRFKRSAQEGKSALECIQKFSDPCHMGVKQEPDEAVTVEGEALVRERRKNTNSLCRLCANVSRFYRNIFMQKHHGIPFYQILNELFCLNVAPGDDFPAWVCQTCHLNVIEFFKFKRLAHYKSSSLPRPSPDVGMVVTKPLVKVRSQESLLERKERQENDRSQRKVPTPVSSPAVDSDSSSPSTSQSTSPGARLYSTAGTGVYTSAFGGSVDDVEDINDYLEWQEYVEFTDFIDSFPLPNSADDTYFESQMLDGMREALSMARMPPGASRRATLNHQQTMRERLQALRSSQANRKRLHELRMMKLKAEIGLKEQKVRHMRNMMAVRKKIMESKEEIRKIKAKTQQLNDWRKLIEEGGSTSNPEGDAVSSLSSLAAEGESVLGSLENVVIKEEPRDYSAMTEVHIKEEPESDTEEVVPGNAVSESLVVNVFPKIEMSPEGEGGETDGSASNQGTEGVGTSSVNEEAVDNSRKRPGCVVGAKDVSASGPKVLRLGYSTETLRHAVESVASHRWSIRKAASHYKIPWGVLRDYVKISQESGYISSLPSRETAGESSLSAENEERLAKFVSEMEQRGFRMSRDMVEQVANAILEEEPSAPCISGSWLDEFCTRHSSNLCSKPDSKRLPPGHKESTLLCDFYDVIKLLHERLGIVVTPDQVWNCDETLLCCIKKDGSVVSKVGRRREFENSDGSEVLANTVLCSGNASGAIGPTMVVLKHASKDSNLLCSKVMVASSKTGCLDFKLFKRWFTEFIRDVQVQKPLLLLIDAQNNHLSPEVIDLAVENSVIFIPIYFNDSGSPQPIQASVLHSLQESWISYIEKFQRSVSTVVPRTADFLSWFPSALRAADVEDSIIAGFCRAAVYPPHRWVLEKPETSGCEVGEGGDATSTKFEMQGTSFKQCLKELIKGLYTKKQSSDSTR